MLSQITNSKQINRQFAKYVIPSVIGMLVQALYVIMDGVIVGQGIGEVALGAVNIVFPFTMFSIALAMLIGAGGANVYSFHKGKGETEKANNIFCQCMGISVVVGAALALSGFVFRENLCVLLGANAELLPEASAYMKWIALFTFIQIVSYGLSVFVRNDDAPKIVMLGSVFGAIVNTVLDIVLILILHYGIEVAAITNGIGMIIELLFCSSHFIRKKGTLRIRKPIFCFHDIKRVLKNGFASFLMEFNMPALAFSYNLAVVHSAGTLGVTAYSIATYVCSIIHMVIIGILQGVQPMMSFYHGKGDKKTFSYVYRLGARINMIVPALLVGLCVIFGGQIVPLFHSGNADLTALTAHMLRQYPLAYIFVGITLMNTLYFQTIEKNGYATLISFLRCVGFMQVFLLLSIFVFHARGLYLAFLAGEVCLFVVSQLFMKKIKHTQSRAGEMRAVVEPADANTSGVITISREYASGGRMIGRKVAEALGVPFYDRGIIGLAAEKAQLSAGVVEETEEKMDEGFQYGLYTGRKYMPIPDQVFIAQSKTIEEIAGKGCGVIVGRCADHILKNNVNCFHIFIHAPFEQRVRRAVEEYGLPAKNARQVVRDNDAARESYYNHYTGAKWGEAHHYHLSINSEIGVDQCVELILHTEQIKSPGGSCANQYRAEGNE